MITARDSTHDFRHHRGRWKGPFPLGVRGIGIPVLGSRQGMTRAGRGTGVCNMDVCWQETGRTMFCGFGEQCMHVEGGIANTVPTGGVGSATLHGIVQVSAG